MQFKFPNMKFSDLQKSGKSIGEAFFEAVAEANGLLFVGALEIWDKTWL